MMTVRHQRLDRFMLMLAIVVFVVSGVVLIMQ